MAQLSIKLDYPLDRLIKKTRAIIWASIFWSFDSKKMMYLWQISIIYYSRRKKSLEKLKDVSR